jgi:RND family efflux transporter MFP subunit
LGSTRLAMLLLAPLVLSACQKQEEAAAPAARPVRTVTVEKSEAGTPVSLTGRIGDRVEAGQVVARLEPQNEENTLRSANAAYVAAQAALTQAQNHFDRQDTLLQQGWTTRANHDQALKALQTAQAQVEAAQAQLKAAHDLVSFTQLEADAPGVVTAVGPRAGSVVQAGQMIATLARKDGRDAVFDVPQQLLRAAPPDPEITVRLTGDPNVVAHGRVREVAPQADPVTRTFEVRVGLSDPPAQMLLGATVNGQMEMNSAPVVDIPASALTRVNQQPAVWVLDPSNMTVTPRNIEVLRFDPGSVAVANGLSAGDIIVTAGVQALYPGQKVRLLGSS